MNRMETFITGVAERTGVSPSVARSATHGLLVTVMEKAAPRDAEAMYDLIPGTGSVVRRLSGVHVRKSENTTANLRLPRSSPQGPEGSVFEFLYGCGVPRERSGTFLSAFLDFLDERVGPKVARGVAGELVL